MTFNKIFIERKIANDEFAFHPGKGFFIFKRFTFFTGFYAKLFILRNFVMIFPF